MLFLFDKVIPMTGLLNPHALRPQKIVVFDVGETLMDETAIWQRIADRMNLPPFTVAAAAGIALARENGFTSILDALGNFAGIDGTPWHRPDLLDVGVDDLYDDVIPGLTTLRAAGFGIGICGNQPASTEQIFHELPVEIDWVSSSARLGLRKPDPQFFDAICQETGRPPHDIIYVGDRLDNDVYPAIAFGMQAIWLLRGPWSFAQWQADGIPDGIDAIRNLHELSALIGTSV